MNGSVSFIFTTDIFQTAYKKKVEGKMDESKCAVSYKVKHRFHLLAYSIIFFDLNFSIEKQCWLDISKPPNFSLITFYLFFLSNLRKSRSKQESLTHQPH